MKHFGPFQVRHIDKHRNGVISIEKCLTCGGTVRRPILGILREEAAESEQTLQS